MSNYRPIINTFLLAIVVGLCFRNQVTAQGAMPLEPGKLITRTTTRSENHTYQLKLTAGQYIRIVAEEIEMGVRMTLVTADNNVVMESDFNHQSFGQDSLSWVVPATGEYRLLIRPFGIVTSEYGTYGTNTSPRAMSDGIYQVRLEVKETATVQDKRRITAEELLREARLLRTQPSSTIEPSVEKYRQAIQIWQELGDKTWEAITLSLIGRGYIASKNVSLRQGNNLQLTTNSDEQERDTKLYAQAIDVLTQTLTLQQELLDQAGQVSTLSQLGVAHRLWGNISQALVCHEQALNLSRARKNYAAERLALNNLATHFMESGKGEKEIDLLISSGSSYRLKRTSVGNKQGIEYLEQVLALDRANKKRMNEGYTLYRIGFELGRLRDYQTALKYQDEALHIIRSRGNWMDEDLVLRELIGMNSRMSRYEKAIEHAEHHRRIWREQKSINEAGPLLSLGQLYRLLNRNEKAIEYLEQASRIISQNKNPIGESNASLLLSEAHIAMGNYDKAMRYAEQVAAIYREMKLSRRGASEARAIALMGIISHKQGRLDTAIEHLKNSVDLYEHVLPDSSNYDEAFARANLGEVWRDLGQTDKAIDSHLRALRLARKVPSRDLEALALSGLLQDWKARQQPQLATYFGKQAVNIYQELRSDFRALGAETQRSFLQSKEPTYRELADLLIAQGRLPEAEQVIRMLKEEEYFEYVRRDMDNSPKGEKAALTPEEAAIEKRYREIADKLTEIGSQRSELLAKEVRTLEDEKLLTKLEADLTIANQMFQKFLDGVANELGKNAEASNRVFQLRESQGMMDALRDLGKGTVAIYTLVGEDQYRVILTTADVQKGFAYPIKAADLNRKILAFRDVLQNPKLDPLPLAQELYQILVAPLAKDLKAAKAETVMWSLDGVLRYVPMAALHDGEKYLVERWRNVVFTPASQTRLKDDVSRNWKALGLGVTRSFGERIPALPGVAEEMRGIIKADGAASGVLPGTIKLDEQFTQDAMLTGLRQRPPVVHVASHFQFKPGNETDSALLLGDGQFLSLAQIKSLPNVFSGVELLTLSACNTATGGSGATGKEVEGFGVLAQRQGAKAVVASLWPVADRSTKELMQEFYKLREAKSRTPKAEAMRQAQVKLLRGELVVTIDVTRREIAHETDKATNAPSFKPDLKKPYAHPYYWAPFILIGNWK